MDSGTNIVITNQQIVAKFNLTLQRWQRPFHIIFGNGALTMLILAHFLGGSLSSTKPQIRY